MQSKPTTNLEPIPRGVPSFAPGQRGFVLRKLREAGERGVSRSTFIFEYHVTQCRARIDELRRQGYEVASELRPGDKYVTYALRGEPEQPKSLRSFGQKKLFGERPAPDYGLLFDAPTEGRTR